MNLMGHERWGKGKETVVTRRGRGAATRGGAGVAGQARQKRLAPGHLRGNLSLFPGFKDRGVVWRL